MKKKVDLKYSLKHENKLSNNTYRKVGVILYIHNILLI